jgi:hypothetical protein
LYVNSELYHQATTVSLLMDCCSGQWQHSALKHKEQQQAVSDLAMSDQNTQQQGGLAQLFIQADSAIERRR